MRVYCKRLDARFIYERGVVTQALRIQRVTAEGSKGVLSVD
jgi:hypothetical protein